MAIVCILDNIGVQPPKIANLAQVLQDKSLNFNRIDTSLSLEDNLCLPQLLVTTVSILPHMLKSLLSMAPRCDEKLRVRQEVQKGFLLCFQFIPESARYNVSTGNTGAALATLQRIARMNGAAMPEGQLREPAKERRGRFKDLIHPKYLRTTLQIWIIWLGIAFAYYGVILASAELLERDLVCGSAAPPLQDSSDDSEESHSPCHCRLFGPAAYQSMIISTAGEITLNPVNILSINFLGRRLSLCITMGCTALFFLLLNICTSSAGMVGFLFMLRALVSANFNTIYIYTAEVYPTTMRALGMGTSGAVCRVGAMVAPFISQVLMSASFLGALCLFSSVCIICAISAVTLPIETKGRALQQVK
uniref:putative transporter SVOPL n=1 Tax=Lonchura striata TaxID=40157 RepID=UPI00129366FE|nr:putative transporter SVOPL [Lonchura striata domestica]